MRRVDRVTQKSIPAWIASALAAGLLLVLSFPTGAHAQLSYAGIFRAGSGASGAWVGREWPDFLKQWQAFEKQGLRMVDFETYTEGGKRLWAGIFAPGTYTPAAYIGKEWPDFLKQWQAFEKQGYRIIDFETWTDGGKRVYGGIFAPGTYAPAAYIGKEWPDFLKQWQAFEKQGYRIFDFETYTEGGKRLYAGIFKPGTYVPAAYIGKPWPDFLAHWQGFEKQGYRMRDFETYVDGGQRLYAGIFEPGNDAHGAWIGVDWESFISQWHSFEKSGLRLTDLEVYEGSCSNNCANSVVMPACPDDPNCSYNYGVTATATHCEGAPGTCKAPSSGDVVWYRWPVDIDGGKRYVRHSALQFSDKIFTLPFKPNTVSSHNGWRYGDGTWHHAIDYSTDGMKTFQVAAAAPGKVIHIGWDLWSGNTVVVSHDAGGVKDAYRTIYMHLRNGADKDCDTAWNKTVPWMASVPDLSDELSDYKSYLNASGCKKNKADRNLDSDNWGTNESIDTSLLGKPVAAGQVLAWAGQTGPGGGRDKNGAVNTHLHIFWAHRDPTDKRWYFFDPYGIYGKPECYPSGITDSLNIPCARYPIAFKGGKPQFP